MGGSSPPASPPANGLIVAPPTELYMYKAKWEQAVGIENVTWQQLTMNDEKMQSCPRVIENRLNSQAEGQLQCYISH